MPDIPEKTDSVYKKVKLLSGFLDDEDEEVVYETEKALRAMAVDYLPLLKEFREDVSQSVIKGRLNNIIEYSERKIIENNLYQWSKEAYVIFTGVDILSEISGKYAARYNIDQDLNYLVRDIFFNISYDATFIDTLKLLVNKTSDYITHDSKLRNSRFYNFLKLAAPKDLLNYLLSVILYRSVAERLDIPLVFLIVDNLPFLGLKNEGRFYLEIIEEPYLALLLPVNQGRSFSITSHRSFLKNLKSDEPLVELHNLTFISYFMELLTPYFTAQRRDDITEWLLAVSRNLRGKG